MRYNPNFFYFIFILLLELKSLSCEQVSSENAFSFGVVKNWPTYNEFGQISGVGIDNSGNIYVFHRGNRQWDSKSFSNDNVFLGTDPIRQKTIVVLEPTSGSLITKTGEDFFFLPHGLTVDHENSIWVTDVALHQVFKFPFLNFSSSDSAILGKPLLTLGVPLEPGSDDKHFCKPTDVAVDKYSKDFYVSDGYCNSRIIKYDQFGKKLLSFGRSSLGNIENNLYMLNLPHALALAQNEEVIYIADRENYRVLSFNSTSGVSKFGWQEKYGNRVFGVAYAKIKNMHYEGGLIFSLINNENSGSISVYNATSKKALHFSSQDALTNPHDIAISADGRYCYVVELTPYKIWKFEIDFGEEFNSSFLQTSPNILHSSDLTKGSLPFRSTTKEGESGSLLLAVFLVSMILIISLMLFAYHCYKVKGGYRRYEFQRLIHMKGGDGVLGEDEYDDDEDGYSINGRSIVRS